MTDPTLVGKLVLKGKLSLRTPLIIGSGSNDLSDIEVLKDESGTPYIPATSLVGVLRHMIEDKSRGLDPTQSDYFWGSEKSDGAQSALCCHDLRTEGATIKIRDGVAIDPAKGIAVDEKKYDYEVVEPGTSFMMYMEITMREAFDKTMFENILATICHLLKEGKVALGAKTTSGFGNCKLEELKFYDFDFSKRDDIFQWLKQEMTSGTETTLGVSPLPLSEKIFLIDAAFSIKNSLIVRSYASDELKPDAVHLTSNGKNVLPGTSIKGAIRARGLKILKTLGRADAEDRINSFFGFVNEKDKKSRKGKVVVEETEIRNVEAELQQRIKIDRFTGGTIKGALFDSMPLWNSENGKAVQIKMRISEYEKWELGLLLLILKDLWSADLPIGGEKSIGRGVLKGVMAKIKWDGEELRLEEKENRLVFSNKKLADKLNRICMEVYNA